MDIQDDSRDELDDSFCNHSGHLLHKFGLKGLLIREQKQPVYKELVKVGPDVSDRLSLSGKRY